MLTAIGRERGFTMDPNKVLDEMLRLAGRIISGEETDGLELAEAVENLDEWITHGGFLPTRWEVAR